ncbi:MAG: VOC family protein [Bacteroidota bacterium]
MKTLNRMMTNICSKNLDESKVFYTSLFDFSIDYDSDWFIHLISKDKQLELGIINATHEIVPKSTQTRPEGFYITFVVEKADAIFQIAKNEGFDIVSEPTDTFYGQRRLLLRDPNGVIVDVSSPIPNFQF